MKIYCTSQESSEDIIRKICGKGIWIKAEADIEADHNQYHGSWLHWLKILSIDDDGYCQVNYLNLDFPDDSYSLDDVGEVHIDDIMVWFPVELIPDEEIEAEFEATDDPDGLSAEDYDHYYGEDY